MSSAMRIWIERTKIRNAKYTDAELCRMMRRVWEHIDSWYGRGCWDWPTLYYTFPQLACVVRAIQDEMRARNEEKAKGVMCG